MTARQAAAEGLARVLCDAFFGVCELPTRWPVTNMDQRDTFRTMTRAALAAGRQGLKTPDEIAQALCQGFWHGFPHPRAWAGLGLSERQVFRLCAEAFLAAARELRSRRQDQGVRAA